MRFLVAEPHFAEISKCRSRGTHGGPQLYRRVHARWPPTRWDGFGARSMADITGKLPILLLVSVFVL